MTQPFRRAVSDLPGALETRLEAVIRAAVPTVAPALAVSVWQSGVTRYEAYAGWVEPGSEKKPVDDTTLFDLASLTKLITTTAFLRLTKETGIDLDDAVVTVIPEFGERGQHPVDGGQEPLTRRILPTPPDRADWRVDPAAVTFRQLLTHTAGLAPWRAVFRESGPTPPPPGTSDVMSLASRRAAGLAAVCRYPFVARPGAEYHYSDLGFILLGEASLDPSAHRSTLPSVRSSASRSSWLRSPTDRPRQTSAGCYRTDEPRSRLARAPLLG